MYMVFSSIIFLLLFLPVVTIIYYTIRKEFRNGVLLVASLLFYTWGEPKYIIIMLSSIIINYLFAVCINFLQEKNADKKYQRISLILCIVINIGLLVIFKYTNFMVDNINVVFRLFGKKAIEIGAIALPIGISFYTLQALSYVVDVYRKTTKVQKNLFDLGLFISLFPQLIAGPIVRYHDIADQLKNRTSNSNDFAYGIRRFIIGLGKKVIIANTMGSVADSVFCIPNNQLSLSLSWLGIISYSIQIYYDFSAYSDMAIGLGQMFGFKFLENFNYPYISKSITEFWKRWHISLSNWFKDYLYIPLGGNRKGNLKTYRNLLIVFLCTGIWHGASWNFLFWGIYYGVFLILERMKFIYFDDRLGKSIGRVYTLLVVLIGWVFFRSDSFSYSIGFIKSMFGISHGTPLYDINFYCTSKYIIVFICSILGCTPLISKLFHDFENSGSGKINCIIRDTFLVITLFISIMFLSSNTYNPFIYFRF